MEGRGGMVAKAVIVLCLASNSLAKVSLYLSSDQTEALYGIKTDGLYYVREGVVNKYAMNFQHQVKLTLIYVRVRKICICSRKLEHLRKSDTMACLEDHATPRRYIEP